MKVVIPANAHDAKGLMHAAIADDNPVIFMFHKALQGMGWLGTVPRSIVHVPAERYEVPIGRAAVVRPGRDATLVGWGATLHHALDAAETLAGEGIEAEVIDVRTLAPLDRETIVSSVERTRRLVVADDDYFSCGVAAEIIASVCESTRLVAPPRRVCFPDVPVPFAPELEHSLLPDAAKIVTAARATLRGAAA